MITFVTSNGGKFQDFQAEMALFGLTGTQAVLPLTEPQDSSIEQIALAKARQAYAVLQRPLIVEDSGLCIPALNNFPEALTKPVLEQVGLANFLTMLEGVDDRRCFFRGAVAYIDANGAEGTITSEHEAGELVRTPEGELSARARSALWQIFKPDGFDRCMAAMDDAELQRLFAIWRTDNIFKQFATLASRDPARFGLEMAA